METKPVKKIVSITGGTGLIGSAIVNSLSLYHHVKVIKERLPNIDLIIDEIDESDVFINNAMHKWGQVDLLIRLYNHWRSKEKLIINIGSRSAAPNVSCGYEYSTVKAALNHFSDLVRFKDTEKKCRLTTINPGLVGQIEEAALDASYLGDLVSWLICQPNKIELSRIDVSHIAPYELVQRTKAMNKGNLRR